MNDQTKEIKPGTGAAVDHPAIHNDTIVQDVSGWVLRIGVILSVVVMLVGFLLSYFQNHPTVKFMEHATFKWSTHKLVIGVLHGSGESIIELGLLLLVLTPVTRVAVSVFLFTFVDKDRFYALVTLGVLALTLISLFFIR
jgi:uncharacterized membrane protein